MVGRQPTKHHAARVGEDDADRLALETLAQQALQHRQGAAGQRRAGAGIANVARVDVASRDIPPPRTLPARQDRVTSGATAGPPPSAAEFRCVPLTLRSHPKTSNSFPEFDSMFHGGKPGLPDQPRVGQRTDRHSLGEGWGQCPRPFPPGLLQPPPGPADPRQHLPLPPGRLDLLADRHPPIAPAAFRELDAAAVLTGPSLPVPLLTRPIAPFGLTWSAPRPRAKAPPRSPKPSAFPAPPSTGTWPSSSARTAGHLAPGRSFGSPGPISRSPAPPTRARACGRLTRAARSWP